MTEKKLEWFHVFDRAGAVADQIAAFAAERGRRLLLVYPVPRGGVPAVLAVREACSRRGCIINLTDDFAEADLVVDDIIDTGETRLRYASRPFFALVNKPEEGITDWVSFPWERSANETGPQENIIRILQYIGEDPKREGLVDTPDRVVRSYSELFSGYQYKTDEDVARLIRVFEDGVCKEMVIVQDISFVSFCEHHMLPFTGVVHVAYIPRGRVIGLSKIPRLVEVYSRRLQVQERLTEQVTAALNQHLKPAGSACVVVASHSCMSCRGVRQAGATMKTSSLTGEFLEPAVRQEFFSLIGK